MRKALLFTLVSGAVGLATVFACGVDDLNLEGRACPCGPGYICDTPRNVCVKPEVLLDGAIIVGEAAVNPPTPPPPADSGAPPCKGPDCTCASDPDCVDPAYPKCSGNKCVQCVALADGGADNCAVGSYCVTSTNVCAPGCKTDAECSALSPLSPRCNIARHQCVQCAGDGDCTGGLKCSPAGACATGCFTDGGACGDGGTGTCCKGLCVDVTSDPFNCNACGNACSNGATNCCAGTCSNPLTDKNNCGRCAFACNSTVNNTGSSCSSGRCGFTCTAGFGHCQYGNTGCETNTTTSTSHCGSCNTDCGDQVRHASGIFCASSSCNYTACFAGYSELDGKLYDGCEAPCGAIGQPCCNNTSCPVSGTCEPAPANDGFCH